MAGENGDSQIVTPVATLGFGARESADETRQAQQSVSNDAPTDVNFNAEGGLALAGDCPKGHGDTQLVTSWEAMAQLCFDLDRKAGEKLEKRQAN